MKKFIIPLLALICAVGVVKAITLDGTPQEIKELTQTEQCEEALLSGYQTVDIYRFSGSSGTTTAKYLATTDTASSSIIMSTGNISNIDMNVWAYSSTTVPVLYWKCFYSEDGIDWYGETGYTETSDIAITHGTSDREHSWTPTATTTVGEIWKQAMEPCKTEPANTQINSAYTKIDFGVGSAMADVYIELKTLQTN